MAICLNPKSNGFAPPGWPLSTHCRLSGRLSGTAGVGAWADIAIDGTGRPLGFRVFDKIRTVQPGAIVDNKRLSAVLEQVKAQQAAYPAHQQRGHTARRRPAEQP